MMKSIHRNFSFYALIIYGFRISESSKKKIAVGTDILDNLVHRTDNIWGHSNIFTQHRLEWNDTCACAYLCVCVCVCVCVRSIQIHLCVFMSACDMSVWMCLAIFVCMVLCGLISLCERMYLCVCVYVYALLFCSRLPMKSDIDNWKFHRIRLFPLIMLFFHSGKENKRCRTALWCCICAHDINWKFHRQITCQIYILKHNKVKLLVKYIYS